MSPRDHRSSTSSKDGDHCHSHLSSKMTEVDKIARRKLIIASILCLGFTIGEAVGGALANSLAVATDAAHMLTDFASFMISLLAIYLASRRPTTTLSFGWHRAEIIGALVSVLMIWIVTGILVYMAVLRVIDDNYELDAVPMMITAGIAVAVNIFLGLTLHGVGSHGHSHGGGGHSHGPAQYNSETTSITMLSSAEQGSGTHYGATDDGKSKLLNSPLVDKKENINVRAAMIHVIGDFIQSIGVLTAAIIIYFKPEWKLADPICTFLFSVLVLFSTINILKEAVRVLMQATPHHIEFASVKETLLGIENVQNVHNLRIWSLTNSKFTASVHIAIQDVNLSQGIVQEATKVFSKEYDVQDCTIQIEIYSPEMQDCDHCQDPDKA
ncbi:proton-coupled zinc antiporter SLC30A2-like [Watersipora subatra]|uniref:proton-coupled zinc antiporter SLC30A2-like n=1 Tax=Watersipora subatra TaxID=2589382 RepID=UPI00355C04FE